jgi:hypothetical protein
MASFEIVQQRASGKAVLKRSLGKFSMDDDLKAACGSINAGAK